MKEGHPRSTSDWEKTYVNTDVRRLPWYLESLDPDFEAALRTHRISPPNYPKVLDLGCGAGTQSLKLSNQGFDVTGTDIAEAALDYAKKMVPEAKFVCDNMIKTKLPTNAFNLIIDRGVFHTIRIENQLLYIKNVWERLIDNGLLLLKCFSTENVLSTGPNQFSPEDIRLMWAPWFETLEIRHSNFLGTLDYPPKALFCILRKTMNFN